ncbi:D-glycero-beta-D-manno-heptose 1-phosphate adenylyltransferase [Candidatus Woesearchaeota archaeon]|nr:D-glycero-beta-D-manno-heptose 1-phosphate adenylyltransferase [Candidatus Woesearchaeota archaeon]MBW3017366.1 D-glycero-beta-D-manno-heptose 1-phosphate adenylyltransferase [Candidatus Woesearchaeota archaeon]
MKKRQDVIADFSGKNILVVGDIMLDEYVFGHAEKISQEAPVLVLSVKNDEYRLGGAANTANNIVALGANCKLIGVTGNDEARKILEKHLKDKGIKSVLINSSKPTIRKTRMISQSQQIVRIDREDKAAILPDVEKKVVDAISSAGKFDAIIVSDYAKGTITRKILAELKKKKTNIFVDPKPEQSSIYSDFYLMTPNQKEAESVFNFSAKTQEDVDFLGKQLVKRFNSNIVLTRGRNGMSIFELDGSVTHLPTEAKEVYDVSGAGDTVVAALALGVAAGADLKEAAIIANHAAAIKIGKFGTAPVHQKELEDIFTQEQTKIKTRKQIEQISKELKAQGKVVVFTNGCFDILHVGHVRLLEKAKSLGDVLVLGLNTDASVKRLKGPTRPIINERERAEVMAALSFVDYVVFFDEDEPSAIIRQVKPSIHVKGGDYKADDMPETPVVKKYGGKVVIIPLVKGKSTTKIIEATR